MLLSISAYARPPSTLPNLDDAAIEAARRGYGGQLSLMPATKTRWYLSDLEAAEYAADAGEMLPAGMLMRWADRDGVVAGLMEARAGGLVRLPKRWAGAQDMVDELQAGGSLARSTFDEMCPASELEAFLSDMIRMNLAVGELVPVEGRAFPVFVRRSPEYLMYRWAENRWYFRSAVGLIPVEAGDGRWVLFTGGAEYPWQRGKWRAVARATITKDHARHHRDNWEAKLANPARVGETPAGADASQRATWFRQIAGWGVNTTFLTPPGYSVKLLESNGRGADSWPKTIEEQDRENMIAILGQVVSTTGGSGFLNKDLFENVRHDLIQKDGINLAHVVNTQILPAWVASMYGVERLEERPTIAWDTTPPEDLARAAAALTAAATMIQAMSQALTTAGLTLDVEAVARRFGVPLRVAPAEAANANGAPRLAIVRGEERAA